MEHKRIACITGISGQDGSYLSEFLLSKNYIIYGLIRRNSNDSYPNIEHIRCKLNLVYGDITDYSSVSNMLNVIVKQEGKNFDRLEIFNLCAQSHVKVSFDIPIYTGMVDAIGTINLLECIRNHECKDKIRFYQASTSELFGKNSSGPQSIDTAFYPASPYGVAKLYSYWIVKNYRENYNLFLCNGILFNHSSPRRTPSFVCRKITLGVAAIHKGEQDCLYLGNLNSMRDLGHSRDYIEGMWLMLQQDKCKDYILSTQETFSIRQLVEMAFQVVKKKIIWEGKDLDEVGTIDGKVVVRVSKEFFRPSEVDFLLGNSEPARQELGWQPKYSTQQLIQEMVLHDLHT